MFIQPRRLGHAGQLKKWASKPLLTMWKAYHKKNGKPVLKKGVRKMISSNYMRNAGYTDVERGERGSTEEHLTVTHPKSGEQERSGYS